MRRIKSLFSQRSLLWQLVFLFLSAIYLFGFPQPNLIYPIFVLFHTMVGVVATILLLASLSRLLRTAGAISRIGWLLLLGGGVLGCVLIYTGTVHSEFRLLYTHIILCLGGTGILFAEWAGTRGWLGTGIGSSFARIGICFVLLAGLGAGSWYVRHARWLNNARIENPPDSPATMNTEGGGSEGPFFPSSAQVYGKEKIPSKFFMESDSCKRCHQDIYNQWNSSAHHFSSFNNQWYRKSIRIRCDVGGNLLPK